MVRIVEADGDGGVGGGQGGQEGQGRSGHPEPAVGDRDQPSADERHPCCMDVGSDAPAVRSADGDTPSRSVRTESSASSKVTLPLEVRSSWFMAPSSGRRGITAVTPVSHLV